MVAKGAEQYRRNRTDLLKVGAPADQPGEFAAPGGVVQEGKGDGEGVLIGDKEGMEEGLGPIVAEGPRRSGRVRRPVDKLDI